MILHYDGNDWSEIKTDIDNRLFSIWGSSENDIFTVGAGKTILRYGEPADGSECFFENLYEDNADKVTSLRNFRDDVLNTTRQGKLTVRAYYTISPFLVTLIEHSSWLRRNIEKSMELMLPSLGVVID